MLPPSLQQSLRDHLGPFDLHSIAGGDIHQAYRVESSTGVFFLKSHNRAPAHLFQREADGLAAIGAADPGLVPKVEAIHKHGLLLEWLHLKPGLAGAACGAALARLHRAPAAAWGGQADNFLGTLRQQQPSCASWAALFGEFRLLPLAEGCPGPLRSAVEQLIPRLPNLLDDLDPPCHVHGDLWGGNASLRIDGRPVLFDPAHATAHRELDLSMSLLFGGFSPAFYTAYEDSYPLQFGWRERVPLHQLYFVLAHFHLFGAPYAAQALKIAQRYL